jgi:predicted RNA-binding Zn-ribbon protein involved in translation (DUF1610 family)
MNITAIFEQLFAAYWWVIPILLTFRFLKSPFMKGVFGELQVSLMAKFLLDKSKYTLFKNVTLPTEDGTTQIDHVIVSRYGVFVIETKNMKGWVFGSEKQKSWTQKIYSHTSKFQNPLHQNYKHTQILQTALNIEPSMIFSIVVFVGDSTFKTPMPDNVVYAGRYIRYIKNKTQPLLTKHEVESICTEISRGRLKQSLKTHREHVKHVKTIVAEKEGLIDVKPEFTLENSINSCPKCGQEMVLRTAKRGDNQGNKFWGCSGYPKCRIVKQLS